MSNEDVEVAASEAERADAAAVMRALREAVRADVRINLPRLLGAGDPTSFAVNPFGGKFGAFRYQFEGEDDLLHLIVARVDGGELSPEDARAVAGELFQDIESGLVWLRPGRHSQHFYVGHDDLLTSAR